MIQFVRSPARLPAPPAEGRVVLVDLAFASGADYDSITKPFIHALGSRLAAWIDHHDHAAWIDHRSDPRFVLVEKLRAPACPELITKELVERIGPVEHVLAHADFDGCVAAAKWLRGGVAPYPESDEDARAIDAPGHAFVCSELGRRLNLAMDQKHVESPSAYPAFLVEIAAALVDGAVFPPELDRRIGALAEQQTRRLAEIEPLANLAKRPHPRVLALRFDHVISNADKKTLLRRLEDDALVAVIEEPKGIVLATFRDDLLDLSLLPGLKGGRGFAWGEARLEPLLPHLARLIEEAEESSPPARRRP